MNLIEHHAYLSFDELNGCSQLFEKPVKKILVDLRGRTSVLKQKSGPDKLGIKKLSHTYFDICNNDVEISNLSELNSLTSRYRSFGITNLYMIKLVVHWDNGDMQEWNRHVIHTKDVEIDRSVPSGRLNLLTMKLGTYEEVEKLIEIYGSLVKATVCELIRLETHYKRVCLGTMANV